MAIAYDSTGNATLSPTTSGTSKTATINAGSATDRILWVGLMQGDSGSDIISGATYNGTALTKLVGRQLNGSTQYANLWYLVNPSSGSNTLTVSFSSSATFAFEVFAVYSGAPVATTVIGTNTASAEVASGNLALTLTTQGDNAWIVSIARSIDTGEQTAGSNTVERTQLALSLGDTNAAQTPAGSYSNNWSAASGGNKIAGVAGHFYIGSSTSIKTFDGLAYASTKTVNGLAIASVKTWAGLA